MSSLSRCRRIAMKHCQLWKCENRMNTILIWRMVKTRLKKFGRVFSGEFSGENVQIECSLMLRVQRQGFVWGIGCRSAYIKIRQPWVKGQQGVLGSLLPWNSHSASQPTKKVGWTCIDFTRNFTHGKLYFHGKFYVYGTFSKMIKIWLNMPLIFS